MLIDRMFIHTKVFDRLWGSLGCNDDDLSELQKAICDDPQGSPVIRGTGGVHKIRISLEGRGKSGGARVIYGDFPEHGVVYLFAAYPKNEKEDITEDERKFFKKAMSQTDKDWRNRK
ncbi:MAG: type II toxin-antitoxin system RelE/ParE family toxin [Defluviitaleaceae bacterium]|nr:type II toxin-antitoxin system RelE/ParE family toxin [Defluviitaleaceae bacterium]